jgi:hypothetical protein
MKNELPYEMTCKAIKGYSESPIAKSESNDCVVRAIASSFEIEYDTAHAFVKENLGRKHKKGTFGTVWKLKKLQENELILNGKKIQIMGNKIGHDLCENLDTIVEKNGIKKRKKMTVGQFSKKFKKGVYFILVKGHAFTIKDGVVIGNKEDAIKLKRPIRNSFEVI